MTLKLARNLVWVSHGVITRHTREKDHSASMRIEESNNIIEPRDLNRSGDSRIICQEKNQISITQLAISSMVWQCALERERSHSVREDLYDTRGERMQTPTILYERDTLTHSLIQHKRYVLFLSTKNQTSSIRPHPTFFYPIFWYHIMLDLRERICYQLDTITDNRERVLRQFNRKDADRIGTIDGTIKVRI